MYKAAMGWRAGGQRRRRPTDWRRRRTTKTSPRHYTIPLPPSLRISRRCRRCCLRRRCARTHTRNVRSNNAHIMHVNSWAWRSPRHWCWTQHGCYALRNLLLREKKKRAINTFFDRFEKLYNNNNILILHIIARISLLHLAHCDISYATDAFRSYLHVNIVKTFWYYDTVLLLLYNIHDIRNVASVAFSKRDELTFSHGCPAEKLKNVYYDNMIIEYIIMHYYCARKNEKNQRWKWGWRITAGEQFHRCFPRIVAHPRGLGHERDKICRWKTHESSVAYVSRVTHITNNNNKFK